MKWNVGTKMGVGFGLALVVFVVVGAVSYRSTTQLKKRNGSRKNNCLRPEPAPSHPA